MGKSYNELLKDPRWQKKRLKVLESAGWKCEKCDDKENELHVHHTFYDGRKPWKYPKSSLQCLCKTCHEMEHDDVEEHSLSNETNCPKCCSNNWVEGSETTQLDFFCQNCFLYFDETGYSMTLYLPTFGIRGGTKHKEGYYRNGKKDGTWIEWYPSGGKRAEIDFWDGEFQFKRRWSEQGEKLIGIIKL